MTKRILQIFYLLTIVILFFRIPGIILTNYNKAQFVSFSYFLNFVTRPDYFIFILSLCLLLLSVWCLFTLNQMCRAAMAVLLSILLSVGFAFGKINHSQHVWMLSAYILIFFDPKKTMSDRPNRQLLDLVQVLLLSTYFISGLWKLRAFFSSISLANFEFTVLDYMAYGVLEGNKILFIVSDLLKTHTWVFSYGFILILVFQLGSVVPIFFRHYRTVWGFAACAFHFITGCALGIWFVEQSMAALFFLIFVPLLLKEESA